MAKLLFMMNGVLVYDDKSMFKKIEPTDIIKEGALRSDNMGEYSSLNSYSSIGKTPIEVAHRTRTFFNPMTDEEKVQFKKDNLSAE